MAEFDLTKSVARVGNVIDHESTPMTKLQYRDFLEELKIHIGDCLEDIEDELADDAEVS